MQASPAASAQSYFEETRVAIRRRVKELEQTIPTDSAMKNQRQCLLDGCFCSLLAIDFYDEANRAVQVEAWFAASAIAACALEAALLAQVLYQEPAVTSLPKWGEIQKKYEGDYGRFVRALDLGKLLEIADQLDWFSNQGIPATFLGVMRRYADERTFEGIRQIFRGHENVGHICSRYLLETRNLLHPAVCLRENRSPSAAAGMFGTFVALVAFMSLAEKHGSAHG